MLFRGDASIRAKSGAFLAALLAGEDPEKACRSALGLSVAELEARLFAYVKQTEFTYTVTPLSGIAPTWIPPAVPMDRPAYLSRLGELLSASGNESKADEYYRSALAVDPEHARALAGRAVLRFGEGKCDEARALFDRAVASAPADPTVLFQAGYHGMLELSQGDGDLLRARFLLERGADLGHASGLALSLLGFTYVVGEGEPSHGIDALERAVRRLPDHASELAWLVELYARNEDREGARGAMARLLPVGDPDDIDAARERLVALDVALALRAFEEGDVDRSLELLRGAERAAKDPAVAKEARERIAEIERWLARQRDRERYNSIVPLYRAGKWAEAGRALRALLADCKTEEICKAAREELKTLPK
jgi:tetratricopeptide (TPR) repeat protein